MNNVSLPAGSELLVLKSTQDQYGEYCVLRRMFILEFNRTVLLQDTPVFRYLVQWEYKEQVRVCARSEDSPVCPRKRSLNGSRRQCILRMTADVHDIYVYANDPTVYEV